MFNHHSTNQMINLEEEIASAMTEVAKCGSSNREKLFQEMLENLREFEPQMRLEVKENVINFDNVEDEAWLRKIIREAKAKAKSAVILMVNFDGVHPVF